MARQVWLAFASTRLLLIVTGYLVLTMFPAHPVESWQGIVFPGNNWIDGWVRWDSMWYEAIVNNQPRFLPVGPLDREFLSAVFVRVVDRGAADPPVPRSRARVLHRRADRLVGVVPARTEGGVPAGVEAGGRGRRGPHRVAHRGVPVFVLS